MIRAMSRRAAGILLHPTSLPGRFGIGDLGPTAERFLDWLREAAQCWWQVLPLGPPETHASPYTCLSAFAGNPLLISPERLGDDSLLDAADLEDATAGPPKRVDFAAVAAWKEKLLRRSWERFKVSAPDGLRDEMAAFATAPEQRWLDDWTLFMASRRHHEGRPWWQWDPALKDRDPDALAAVRQSSADELGYHGYLQFLFFRQWTRLREEAHRRGVRILGDLPIYVALDSAEVWTRRELFELDDAGRPLAVAGVPPDYFSADGQLWGNPLYRWDRMAADGYTWWIDRLAANLRLADRVRLDHFRGFAGYWRVPAGAATAAAGEWVKGPGQALFRAFATALGKTALGELPLVAEDLGDITPDVDALREAAGLPGIRVLQFGFDDAASVHAAHNLRRRSVVYTGTHDNDTAAGWFESLDGEARQRVRDYCGLTSDGDLHRAVIRLAYASVAELAVVPLQDVLGLGSAARMNTPSRAGGNWAWRCREGELSGHAARRLRRLAELTGRAGEETVASSLTNPHPQPLSQRERGVGFPEEMTHIPCP